MPRSSIPEELVAVLYAIAEDKKLCERLLSLERLPAIVRRTRLLSIAARMRSAGEDEVVVEAVSALAKTHFYEAACGTLRELYL